MSDDTSGTTQKRLTEAEWSEAKALYETGKGTKSSLAKQFGISRQSMTEGLNARGAVYGAKAAAIEAATVEAQRTDAVKKHEEIAAMRERQLRGVDLLQKLQNKIIGEALRDQKPLSSQNNEFRTLNTLIKNQKLIREELWEIYDLNRDPDGAEEVPEFIVSEYTPDEINAINNQRLGITDDPLTILEQSAATGEGEDALDELLAGTEDE